MTTRATLDLNGRWAFQIDPGADLVPATLAPDRAIDVPGCWQAQFPDLLHYRGVAWYQRTVAVPADWADARVRLTFGAVDYACAVYIDQRLVGAHEGGYLPFGLEVGPFLRAGQTATLMVRVVDVAPRRLVFARWDDERGPDAVYGLDPDELPHGKQSWYCDVSGLWQGVTLERLPATAIERLTARPDGPADRLLVQARLAGLAAPARLTLTARATDGGGPAYTATADVPAGAEMASLVLPMPDARRWSPESPALYDLTATLTGDDGDLDRRTITTGLRWIETRAGRLLLNGRPLYLRSALDQDFYPDTVYTPPSDDYLRDQFLKAKQLGLNSLRLHIKPADPRYLEWADRLGLLIWEEVPSWRTLWPRERLERAGDLPAATRARVEATLFGLIERDVNHPSVIAYSIVNEDWGTQLVTSAADRAWLGQLAAQAQARDPSRLICDNSPCNHGHGPNFHIRTDIDDFHIYYGMPDNYDAFDAFVRAFAQRPGWTFSPYGDAQRTGQEALILSEFGNWGLPEWSALARHWPAGQPPWWVASHAWWHGGGNEASHPAGLPERLPRLSLERVWPDADAFARATQWHQYRALQAELQAIRRHPTLQGFVITEFTDCYWEANGLLDFYRQPKVYHDAFAAIGGPTVLLPDWRRLALWSDEVLRLPVIAVHDGPDDLGSVGLAWALDGGPRGQAPAIELPAGERRPLGELVLTMPAEPVARVARLDLALRDAGGVTVTQADLDLTLVPAALRQTTNPARLLVHAPTGRPDQPGDGVPAALRRLGYRLSPDLAGADLALATDVTDELLAYVRAGGTLLYLPAGGTVSPFLAVVGRSGPWDGNWISAYHFIKPGPWSRRLPLANPLGFAYRGVLPRAVMVGFDEAEHDDLLAGLVVGWGARLAATIAQFQVGRGRVLLSTFNLLPGLEHDPIATVMLHDLIDYMTSPAFAPVKRVS